MTFIDQLNSANEMLKKGNIPLTIEQHGSKLLLRGILPAKSSSILVNPHQQRLFLGIPANTQGLKAATAKAKEINSKLIFNDFHWKDYTKVKETHILIGEAVKLFEDHYFSSREYNAKTALTWKEDYFKPFNKLPQEKPLTRQILEKTILTSKPDSRQRKRLVLAYSLLADKFKIEHDFKRLKGNYSPKEVNPRLLPNDALISQCFDSVPNLQWQWVFRMLACYGLRNHEVFFADLKDYPLCFVSEGKTGERYAYPLYPEWANLWDLKEGIPPNCTGKTHGDLGSRVTNAFTRYKVPFNALDIRHSWARRAFEFNLDPGLAARSMGHSLKVHCETYRRWIDENTYKKVYQQMISKIDRPRYPQSQN